MKSLIALWVGALLVLGAVPLPLRAQDPPSDEDPKEKKHRIREEDAAALFEKGKKFFQEGKFHEAQDQLRMLQAR